MYHRRRNPLKPEEEKFRLSLKEQQTIDQDIYQKIVSEMEEIEVILNEVKKHLVDAKFWRYMDADTEKEAKKIYQRDYLDKIDEISDYLFAEFDYDDDEQPMSLIEDIKFIWERICYSPASLSDVGWKMMYGKKEKEE